MAADGGGDLGPIIVGVFDAIFAFSVALEQKGLLTRLEIAAVLRAMKKQIERQEGHPTPRTLLIERLLPVFETPFAGVLARAWVANDLDSPPGTR